MKFIRKTSGLLLLCIIAATAGAQTIMCTARKSFSVTRESWLVVNNRYGEIKISSSGNDSVTICSTVSVRQKDPELQARSASLIHTGMDRVADTIFVRTSFDNKFFSPPFNTDRTAFSVNYTIIVPPWLNLKVSNSFGDVYVDNSDGCIDLRVSHGNLTAGKMSRGNVKPVNTVHCDYGTVTVNNAGWLTASVKNCSSVNIGSVTAMVISSQFSMVNTGIASSIVCDSKSDTYSIGELKNLVLHSIYSAIEAGSVSGQFTAETQFGSLSIGRLSEGFSLVDIKSNRTPVTIKVPENASFYTDITCSGTLMDIPLDSHSGLKMQSANGVNRLTGIWGSGTQGSSVLRIRADAGKIEIKE